MNKLIVSGHLTEDPKLLMSKAGNPYTTLHLVNKDCRSPVYLAVLVFGKDAEVSCKYLEKARAVEIEAKIETDNRNEGLMYVSEKVIFGDRPQTSEPTGPTAKKLVVEKPPSHVTDEDF
jgi:single-stranded DNA-binding protein